MNPLHGLMNIFRKMFEYIAGNFPTGYGVNTPSSAKRQRILICIPTSTRKLRVRAVAKPSVQSP